jgi:hypothetical protein
MITASTFFQHLNEAIHCTFGRCVPTHTVGYDGQIEYVHACYFFANI